MTIAHQHGIDIAPADAERIAADYNACAADVACTIRAVFPDSVEDRALHVARCESGLNPTARNPRSSAAGVWQIIAATWRRYASPGMNVFDPHDNTIVAHRIWASDGGSFRQWACA